MSGLNQHSPYQQRECDLCGDAHFIYIGGTFLCVGHYKKYLENAMGVSLSQSLEKPVQSDGQMLLFSFGDL